MDRGARSKGTENSRRLAAGLKFQRHGRLHSGQIGLRFESGTVTLFRAGRERYRLSVTDIYRNASGDVYHMVIGHHREQTTSKTKSATGSEISRSLAPLCRALSVQSRNLRLAFRSPMADYATVTAPSVAFIGDEIAGCAPAPLKQGERAMQPRRRFTQTEPLKLRLAAFAKVSRESAERLSGPAREALLTKGRQAETAAHIDDWANSQGRRPPK